MSVLPIVLFVFAVLSIVIWSLLKLWPRSRLLEWETQRETPKPHTGAHKLPDLTKPIFRAPKSRFDPAPFRIGMQILVTLVVLGGAIYIILSQKYDAKDKHWAYGSAGTILGFWLKR